MTDDAFASRSDLQALQSAGRGKVLALAALLLAALAGAGWYYFGRAQGIGNPEDAAKVLVVRPANSAGYSSILKQGGFDAAEGTLEHWIERAKTEVPDLDVGGVKAVMTLADTFGYGFVVFESPADVDFSQLEIPALPDLHGPEVEFAVVSVGDFGFPTRMTVNPPPSKVMASVELSLLGALFAQEQLAMALPESTDGGVAVVQLQDRLSDALDELAKLPKAEQLADNVAVSVVAALVEGERAEPRPTMLGGALESSFAVSLSGGEVLTVGQTFSITTRDGLTPVLVPDAKEVFLFGAPGLDPEQRKACGGSPGDADGRADYALAPAGDALVLARSDGEMQVLDTRAPGCAFVAVDGLTADELAGIAEPAPHPSGQMSWAGSSDDGGVLRVYIPGRTSALELGPVPFVAFDRPVWVGPSHLAAIGREGGEGGSVYLFSIDEPTRVLEIDRTAFATAGEASGPPLYQLAPVGGRTDALLATAGSQPRRLFRLDLPGTVADLFAAPPLAVDPPPAAPGDGDAPSPEEDSAELDLDQAAELAGTDTEDDSDKGLGEEGAGGPSALRLDPTQFTATALTHQGTVVDPAASPDGLQVAFAVLDPSLDRPDAASDFEVAILPIEGGELRLLTQNALEDGRPVFTRDGKFVVISTRLAVPKARQSLTAARYVPVALPQ